MKKIILSAMLLITSSQVNTFAKPVAEFVVKQSNNKEAVDVAIKFINTYTDSEKFSYNLVTPNFAKLYKKFKSADFIDYDRVVNGQDFGKKYKLSKILKVEGNSVYILLTATQSWVGYKIPVKVSKVNGKWLVDGSGDLNIPKIYHQSNHWNG